MKKFLVSSVVLLVGCFYISCNNANSGGTSDKAKKNLDNMNGVIKMFESGDFSKSGDYIAADATDHATPRGEIKGLDSIKAMFNYYGSGMKDTKNEIVKELADDDYCMVWLKQSWTATKDDDMMHLKAGEKGHMETVEVTKHNADGKITDHWGFSSNEEMMKAMQSMQPANMPPANPTDTSKTNAPKK